MGENGLKELRNPSFRVKELESDPDSFRRFFPSLTPILSPIQDWKEALNRFTIQFDERMPRV